MSRRSETRKPSLSSPLRLQAVPLVCLCLGLGVAHAQPPRPVLRRRPPPPVQRLTPQQRAASQQRPAAPPARSPEAQPATHQVPYTVAPYASQAAHPTPAPIVRQPPASGGQNLPMQNAAPQPFAQRPAPSNTGPSGSVPLVVPNRPNQTQQHLAGWMEAHRSMPLSEQQRALDNEPGVRNLPAEEQLKLHNQLRQLNTMPEAQRKQRIDQIEEMDRLPTQKRQQVRDAMSQLGSLPESRQNAVARAFRQSLTLPEGQRQAWLNSPQTRAQFNDNERETIGHLLQVQPAAAQAGFPWAKPPAPQTPHD